MRPTDNKSSSRPTPAGFPLKIRARGHSLKALGQAQFRLYLAGLAVTYTGFWTQMVAQGWLVLRLTDSPFMLGLVMTMNTLPFLVFALPGGVLADRFDKRKIMLVSRIGIILLMALIASLIATDLIRVWHILIIVFTVSSFDALDIPARQASIPRLVESNDVVSAVALSSGAFHGARIVGPAVAGIVIQQVDESGAFLLFAVANVIFIGILLLMKPEQPSEARQKGWAIHRDLMEGLSYVKSNQNALPIVILIGLVSMFSISPFALIPAFARDVLGLNAVGLGTLITALGVGALAAASLIAFAGDISKKGAAVLLSSLLLGISLLLFSQTNTFALAFLALAAYGFFLNGFSSLTMSLLFLLMPSTFHGRVMSLIVLTWGLAIVGNFTTGAIAEEMGTPMALAVAGVYIVLCAVGILLFRPMLRRV